jgi:orotidine-5'-phosphate decarboxylase
MSDLRERLIIALDVSSAAAAQKIVAAVGDSALTYKVGLQLYTAEGPQVIRDLVAAGKRVFLDLKYHDIPNTVASAVLEASALGVSLLTIHAGGGGKMVSAATAAAQNGNSALKILGVTVLTSMDDHELNASGIQGRVLDQVLRLAGLALANGCHGVVSSAHETRELRRHLGQDFLIVNPGIRPLGSNPGDQARVVTPAQAIAAGATHIVIGRPITGASDPAIETRTILEQMSLVASQI